MSPRRREQLINNRVYHVFNRSISEFTIFNNIEEYIRMWDMLDLFRYLNFSYQYSQFVKLDDKTKKEIKQKLKVEDQMIVSIVAYCIMPTHLHLTLEQLADDGIKKYIGRVFDSYSKYFNIKHKRNGPLWAHRFKSVSVDTDEQLLHLTRYIHLNPTSVNLVKKPEMWIFSSYRQYINMNDDAYLNICNHSDLIGIKGSEYKEFVEDGIDYQRNISILKGITFDHYSG
jgi:putative transposase